MYYPSDLSLLMLVFFVSGSILISKGYDCNSDNIGLTMIVGGMILVGTSAVPLIVWFAH